MRPTTPWDSARQTFSWSVAWSTAGIFVIIGVHDHGSELRAWGSRSM